MRTLQLKIDNNVYDTLLAMLKGLPEDKINIIEDEQEDTNLSDTAKMEAHDIMAYSGKIKSFDGIKDPVAWQRKVRSEWDREWEK